LWAVKLFCVSSGLAQGRPHLRPIEWKTRYRVSPHPDETKGNNTMSKNYCLTGVSATLQLGRQNAQLVGNSATELAVRDAGNGSNANLVIAEPTIAAHATTKQYVDGLVNGLSWKKYVRACTAGALPANTQTDPNTLTADGNGALPAQDGVSLLVGDDLLVKEEGGGTSTKNGIYTVSDLGSVGTPWILTRRADAAAGEDATSNAVFCAEGTGGADLGFVQTADSAIYNTTALTWVEFASATPGVASVSDAAAVPAGGASLIEAGPTGPVTLRPVAQTATINPTAAAGILSLDVRPASITATEIANGAVTEAKLSAAAVADLQRTELAGIVVRHATFTFTDGVVALLGPGATQNLELNKSYLVYKSFVCVETAFLDGSGGNVSTVVVQKQNNLTDGGTPTSIQGAAESDLGFIDNYTCDECQVLNGNGVDPWKFQITLTPAGAVQGDGRAVVMAVKLD
jgi:hypothetical protein